MVVVVIGVLQYEAEAGLFSSIVVLDRQLLKAVRIIMKTVPKMWLKCRPKAFKEGVQMLYTGPRHSSEITIDGDDRRRRKVEDGNDEHNGLQSQTELKMLKLV